MVGEGGGVVGVGVLNVGDENLLELAAVETGTESKLALVLEPKFSAGSIDEICKSAEPDEHVGILISR